MRVITKILNYFNPSPFSCKEEEIAFANFICTKIEHALLDENSEFSLDIRKLAKESIK